MQGLQALGGVLRRGQSPGQRPEVTPGDAHFIPRHFTFSSRHTSLSRPPPARASSRFCASGGPVFCPLKVPAPLRRSRATWAPPGVSAFLFLAALQFWWRVPLTLSVAQTRRSSTPSQLWTWCSTGLGRGVKFFLEGRGIAPPDVGSRVSTKQSYNPHPPGPWFVCR